MKTSEEKIDLVDALNNRKTAKTRPHYDNKIRIGNQFLVAKVLCESFIKIGSYGGVASEGRERGQNMKNCLLFL